jgi:hypothetical protein
MKNAEYLLIGLFILLLFRAECIAQDSIPVNRSRKIELHGYVKDLQSFFFNDQPGSLQSGNMIHNRLNFRWSIYNNIYTRIEMRNRLFFGEQVKQTYQFGKLIDNDRGFIDLSRNLIEDTAVVLNTLLDRALVCWSRNKWEITLGRQRINWGVNLVWNPNDIFNAYNYFDFDYEERPGSDALRVQYFSGMFSSFELAWKFSDKPDEQVGAIMYKTNFKGFDLQFFSGIYNKDAVVGAGWAGGLRNTGFKGEASYFYPRRSLNNEKAELSLSVSFDRTFKNDYFAMVSYLYNTGLANNSGNITALSATVLSAKNLMPFEHSFFVQAGKTVNQLINVSAGMIYSPSYKSLIMIPSLTGSLSNNWELTLLAQAFLAEIAGTYKSPGNGVYIRLRYSF